MTRRSTLAFLILGACAACSSGGTNVNRGDSGGSIADAAGLDASSDTGVIDPRLDGSVIDDAGPETDAAAPDAGESDGGSGLDSGVAVDSSVGTTITVAGRLHSYGYGAPVVGASVSIGDSTATSDENGAFSIADVTPPYDLVIQYEFSGPTWQVIEGLTTTNPVIEMQDQSASLLVERSTATIAGTVDGLGDFPLEAGREIKVSVKGGGNGTSTNTITSASSSTEFSLFPGWEGPSASVRLCALEYMTGSNGIPSHYIGFGCVMVDVVDGAIVSGVTVLMSPVSGDILAPATITEPAATTGVAAGVNILFDGSAGWGFRATEPFPVFLRVPDALGLISTGSAVAQYTGGAGGVYQVKTLLDGVVAAFDSQSPLTATPAAGGAIIAGEAFEWDDRPQVALVTVRDDRQIARLTVITARSSWTLPAGVLAPGAYTWNVASRFESTTTDELAVPRGVTLNASFVLTYPVALTVD